MLNFFMKTKNARNIFRFSFRFMSQRLQRNEKLFSNETVRVNNVFQFQFSFSSPITVYANTQLY